MPNDFKLAVCRLIGADEGAVAAALGTLSAAGLPAREVERLRGIRNPAARAAGVGARLALCRALTAAEQQTVFDFGDLAALAPVPQLAVFCRSAAGAPDLEDADLGISLAHSRTLAVCALARGGQIGVDVEPIDRRPACAREIGERFFSAGERAYLAAHAHDPTAFIRIWTRREALGKAEGQGLLAPIDTTAHPDCSFWETQIEGELITVFRDVH